MARRCIELGYSHMAVTDHSEGLRIAHGMDAATRAAQAAEVRALNSVLAAEGHEFRVLHGLEMNVEPDGSGDTDPGVLGELDLVLGAFHSKLRLRRRPDRPLHPRAAQPHRRRAGAPARAHVQPPRRACSARWDEVFEAAAELGVALEVDAYPDRQDLDVELLRRAARHDVWIAVDTDSHHPVDLDAMPLGVAALIEAGVPRERVLNTLTPRRAASTGSRAARARRGACGADRRRVSPPAPR